MSPDGHKDRVEYRGPKRESKSENSGMERKTDFGEEELDYGVAASQGSRQGIVQLLAIDY